MAFREIQRNLRLFDLDTVATAVIEQTTPEIIKLNQRQLTYGFSSTGTVLGRYRSNEYAEYKHYLNPRAGFGNVDAYLTGEYYRAFKAAVLNKKLVIYSTDSKAKKLERKYGAESLYGLDGESKVEYRGNVLKPGILAEFRKKVLT